GVEGGRRVVVAENEPVECALRRDGAEQSIERGRRRVGSGNHLEQGELFGRTEVRITAPTEALVAPGVTREVERADGGIAPVEGQDLEPRLRRSERLGVPPRQARELAR